MATLWEQLYPLLSKEKKEEWRKRYKKKFGKEFVPPKEKDSEFSEMESLSEIDKLIRERPNPTRRNK